LERAVSIQESRLAENPGDPALQGEIAICRFLLEQAHDGLGHADRAQRAFDAGFRAWEAWMQKPARGGMASAALDLEVGWALVNERSPGMEVVDRLTTIRQRLRGQARAAQAEVFFDVVQVGYWYFQTLQRDLTGPPLSSLTAAREAASILS